MRYELTHISRTGARPSNQDRVGVVERGHSVLMVLADGLGGHAGGALAAETAVESALSAFRGIRSGRIANPSDFLALALMDAHYLMRKQGAAQHPPIEPRTTCVLCLVQDGYAYWAHVGDSRLYHLRGGRIHARTLDHTGVERLRLAGVLTEEEMPTHPDKSQLLKCLGGRNVPSISLGTETTLQHGDILLLCSDGLWEALEPDQILDYLRSPTLEEAVEDMLIEAEEHMRNHCDNLSAVCLRWGENHPLAPPLSAETAELGLRPNRPDIPTACTGTSNDLDESGSKTLLEIEALVRRHNSKRTT